MEIKGQVRAIMPVKETPTFKSVEVIIATDFDGKYPQQLSCQLTQGRCALIDNISVGDLVTCEVNLKGREWQNPNTLETKYFNTIEIWKLIKN